MKHLVINKKNLVIAFLLLLILGLVTFLRASFVVIYPVILFVLFGLLNLRVSWRIIMLLLLGIGTIPFAFIINQQPILFNTFLSLYIIFPLLMFFLSDTHKKDKRPVQHYYKLFFNVLVLQMVINNLI